MKTHSSYIFSEVMAVNRSLTKDIKFYKRVLLRSQQRFLEDLDPVSVLDLFLERDYLTYPQVRDIQEQRLTSDKTREIIKKVSAKGVKGYKTFKALLKESHQGHLAEFLDTQEKTLVKEIKMAERKEEKDKQALTHETVAPVQQGNQRIPDEQELTSISAHIGMNWELLGPFLGVPTVTIDQIKLDNSTTQVKIYKMLEAWRSRNPLTATVENLVSAMERCPSVRIDWEALRETIGRFTSMDSKTDDLHQSLGARPKTDQLPLQSKTNKNGGKQSVDDLEKSQNSNGIQETSTGHTYGRTVPGDLSINSVARTPVGNTRVNAPDVSNEYGPDLSNQFIREGSDGQKQPQTSHGKTVHYKFSTDPVDARKEQSSKQLFPPIPNPTSFDQFNNMPSSVATPDVIQSLQSIERKIDNIEKATVPVRSEPQSTHIIAYQEKVDIVDGNREREKEKLRKKMIKERDKRLRKLFTSEDDIKGRLKVLRKQDITDLLNCCGCSKDGAGGFGDIFISKEEIAGLDMKIVIKRVMLKNEADEMKMKSVTSEKLASRTMHFAIVPLLAFMEEPANMAYYFLSPYLENGDLFHAIQEDMKPNDGNSVVLDVETRLRILFHVASAIDFLHTPVKGFREIILHMDIKTQNIVLDKYYNARLIDFGLAREMREGEQHIYTTTKELAHTEGYYRTMKGQKLTRHADYFNFGVVIRELLTGIPFYVEGKKEHQQLKKMNELIISMAMMEMWTPKKKPTKEAEQLNKLSSTCIRDEDGVSSNYVLSVIESIVRSSNVDKWTPCEITQDKTKDSTKDTTKDKHRCEMCLVYPEVEDKVLDHAASCKSNIKVCVACMRNAYLNPIKCHSCDEQIRTIIGQDWGAILIAGNDINKACAAGFKNDIEEIKTVITSKWPLVMGISESKVKSVCPKEPGTDECLRTELKSAITSLNKKEEIQTILIYFSGHYYQEKGKLERVFKLGGENEFLPLYDLQSMLSPFVKGPNVLKRTTTSSRRFIVFFDCCNAPSFVTSSSETKVETEGELTRTSNFPFESGDTQAQERPRKTDSANVPSILSFGNNDDYSIVQINACRPCQRTNLKSDDGSIFKTYLVQALTRKALKKKCHIETAISKSEINANVRKCTDCRLNGDFVTMGNLAEYLKIHLDKYAPCDSSSPVMYAHNVGPNDAKIGYVVNFSADMSFTYNNTTEQGHIPTEMFNDLMPLKTVLFDGYFDKMKITEPRPSSRDFLDILCIEIATGPKRRHRDELDTLEKITGAWYSKRELVVSLREVSEIRRGRVGMFLPKGFSLFDFLKNQAFTKKREESRPLSYSVKAEKLPELLDSIRELEDMELKSNLTNVVSAFQEEMEVLGIKDAELRITFPVKEDGKSLLRNDFVCFEFWNNEPVATI